VGEAHKLEPKSFDDGVSYTPIYEKKDEDGGVSEFEIGSKLDKDKGTADGIFAKFTYTGDWDIRAAKLLKRLFGRNN